MEKEYSVCDFCLTDLNKLPATEAALAKANAEVERLKNVLELIAECEWTGLRCKKCSQFGLRSCICSSFEVEKNEAEEIIDTILNFTGQTSGPVPVSDVCEAAKELDTVCIVGLKDGKISVRYSENGNTYEAIGLLERGKKHLLSVLEED
jgi:hypothetical protein